MKRKETSNVIMKALYFSTDPSKLIAMADGRPFWRHHPDGSLLPTHFLHINMFSNYMGSNDLCSFRFWFLLKVLSQERRWWFQRVSIVFVFIKSKELEFYERKILPVVFHSFLRHYWQWKDFEQQLFVNANFKTFLLNCVTEFHGEDHVESHRVLGR